MSTTQNYAFEKEIGTFDTIDRELRRVEDITFENKSSIAILSNGKVDRMDGHGLISNEKLEQVIENKNHIECLSKRIDRADSDIVDRYTKAEVDTKLEYKASKCELEKHIIDPHAHQELFDQKVEKQDGYSLISDADRDQIGINKDDITIANNTISKMYTQSEVDDLLSNKVNIEYFNAPNLALYIDNTVISTSVYRVNAFKIGRTVFLRAEITANRGTIASGSLYLKGLPVSSNAAQNSNGYIIAFSSTQIIGNLYFPAGTQATITSSLTGGPLGAVGLPLSTNFTLSLDISYTTN